MTEPPFEHIRFSVVETLRQGDCLLVAIDDTSYTAPIEAVYGATIGSHYRHCLEHFEALLNTVASGRVDYDARLRDPVVENDRATALVRTRALIARFRDGLAKEELAAPVSIRCKVSYLGEVSPEVASTFAREAMYAVVHAIHHYALIGIICRLQGVPPPEGFGIAPSTAQHRRLSSTRS
ncbi:MAG: hypothetical protein JJT96_05045 [Opitutales bacterium]|nr:hypothetical protein [Opitutales bacterium]